MRNIFGNGRYANVTATMALVVALGGTSYAAATIGSSNIKNRSIKNVDLAKSSVTSGTVRNGSLLSKDFKSGQLPKGAQGVAGAKGDTGAPGPIGPSDAFQVSRNGISPPVLPAGATTTLVTLPLPAGKYVVWANFDFDDTAGPHTVTCRLKADTDNDAQSSTAAGIGGYNCNMQLVHEFAAAGSATLEVDTPGGSSIRGGSAKVTAIRVGSITHTVVTP